MMALVTWLGPVLELGILLGLIVRTRLGQVVMLPLLLVALIASATTVGLCPAARGPGSDGGVMLLLAPWLMLAPREPARARERDASGPGDDRGSLRSSVSGWRLAIARATPA
jgi:hypothetical protein